jgi:hypothetical protein
MNGLPFVFSKSGLSSFLLTQRDRIENGSNGLNGWERTLTRLRLVLIRRRRKKVRYDPFHPFDPFSILSLWLNQKDMERILSP